MRLQKQSIKSVRIWSYSGPYFPTFRLYSVRMRENADENNSEYEHFSRSEGLLIFQDSQYAKGLHIQVLHKALNMSKYG